MRMVHGGRTSAKLDKKAKVGDMGSRHPGCADVYGWTSPIPYVILKDAPIPAWLCLAIPVVLRTGRGEISTDRFSLTIK